MVTVYLTYRERSRGVVELVEGRAPVMQGCMLSSLHRIHASKWRAVLKQLEGYHTERVDIHFEVVGLVSEDFRRHVSVGACFPCQPELGVQIVASVLIDRQ